MHNNIILIILYDCNRIYFIAFNPLLCKILSYDISAPPPPLPPSDVSRRYFAFVARVHRTTLCAYYLYATRYIINIIIFTYRTGGRSVIYCMTQVFLFRPPPRGYNEQSYPLGQCASCASKRYAHNTETSRPRYGSMNNLKLLCTYMRTYSVALDPLLGLGPRENGRFSIFSFSYIFISSGKRRRRRPPGRRTRRAEQRLLRPYIIHVILIARIET